eukprot:GHVS01024981.1.p1 GENE.GHVS01024981.1~~GHVS01024981.1.p1  ORF type:complete len:135 (+),score=1.17 GHVS01024981.1:803-1207(+)
MAVHTRGVMWDSRLYSLFFQHNCMVTIVNTWTVEGTCGDSIDSKQWLAVEGAEDRWSFVDNRASTDGPLSFGKFVLSVDTVSAGKADKYSYNIETQNRKVIQCEPMISCISAKIMKLKVSGAEVLFSKKIYAGR